MLPVGEGECSQTSVCSTGSDYVGYLGFPAVFVSFGLRWSFGAALGESRIGKGNERVVLKVKIDDKEVVAGTLAPGRLDQISLDLIFHKDFVLSHNSSSSVYFCGYKKISKDNDPLLDDDSDSSESDEEAPNLVPLSSKENDKAVVRAAKTGASETRALVAEAKAHVVKPKPETTMQEASDDEDDNDDDSDDDHDSVGEDEDGVLDDQSKDDQGSDDEDNSDEDDESEESQEERLLSEKKRPNLGRDKGTDKKAKLTTPFVKAKQDKVDKPSMVKEPSSVKKDAFGKKPQGKESSGKGSTPSSEKKFGQYTCQPCKKTFQTESALSQHNAAKHK